MICIFLDYQRKVEKSQVIFINTINVLVGRKRAEYISIIRRTSYFFYILLRCLTVSFGVLPPIKISSSYRTGRNTKVSNPTTCKVVNLACRGSCPTRTFAHRLGKFSWRTVGVFNHSTVELTFSNIQIFLYEGQQNRSRNSFFIAYNIYTHIRLLKSAIKSNFIIAKCWR